MRLRQNFASGVVDDNPLTSGATTLTSSALASLVAVGSTQHLAITLDPGASGGAPEIVYVTAHTASATTATILRGQEGTSARSHAQNTPWTHGPTKLDLDTPSVRLARTIYNPGTLASYSTSSATYGDVDATNLAVTFIAPASGNVDVYAEAVCNQGGAAGREISWNLRNGGSDVSGTARSIQYIGGVSVVLQARARTLFQLTGLTPNTSYTLKLGHASTSTAGAVNTYAGGSAGPAMLDVWSA